MSSQSNIIMGKDLHLFTNCLEIFAQLGLALDLVYMTLKTTFFVMSVVIPTSVIWWTLGAACDKKPVWFKTLALALTVRAFSQIEFIVVLNRWPQGLKIEQQCVLCSL